VTTAGVPYGNPDLSGRTAIITGASRGIGFAGAAALLARGASVCITGRKQRGLDNAAATLGAGDRLLTVAGHAADADHRDATVAATMERFGSVDILVSNTGINPHYGPLMQTPLEAMEKAYATNVAAMLGWAQCAYRAHMGEHGGAIVNVSSAGGVRPAPNVGAYAVSKAALIHLTKQLALELAPAIRVNAIAPATVKTEFAKALFDGQEARVAAQHPLQRLGRIEDTGSAIAFLASDESAWITGHTLVIDGGLVLTTLADNVIAGA
jgi:NAD(P)-dependent dehydrogenase (short-subunit alcohol dehydrogenase family)